MLILSIILLFPLILILVFRRPDLYLYSIKKEDLDMENLSQIGFYKAKKDDEGNIYYVCSHVKIKDKSGNVFKIKK